MTSNKLSYILNNEAESYYARNKTKKFDEDADNVIAFAKELIFERDCGRIPRWLEVDCSDASRFDALRRLNLDPYGVEPGATAAKIGSARKNNIQVADVGTFSFSETFDYFANAISLHSTS